MGDKKNRLRRTRKIIPDPLMHPPPPATLESPTTTVPDDSTEPEQLNEEEEEEGSLGSIASILAQRSNDDEDTHTEYESFFDKMSLQQLFNFANLKGSS
jgi:hypothetical protein